MVDTPSKCAAVVGYVAGGPVVYGAGLVLAACLTTSPAQLFWAYSTEKPQRK